MKKNLSKIIYLLICGILFVSCFSGCGQTTPDITAAPTAEPTPSPTPLPVVEISYTDGKVVDPYRLYNSDNVAHDVLALGQVYPDLIKVQSIGKSYFGKEMFVFYLGKGSTSVLMTASTHARENVDTNLLMREAEEIAYAYTNNQSFAGFNSEKIKELLDNYTICICPMNNPDGVDIVNTGIDPEGITANDYDKITWKANGRGVDPNRNFPYCWEEMKADDVDHLERAKMNFPGDEPASEPEVQNLMNLVKSNDFKFCINFHTKGKIVYWRDAHMGEIPGDEKLANLIENCLDFEVAGVTKSNQSYGGGFENWFRQETGNPGICCEMTQGGEGDIPYNHPNRGSLAKAGVFDIYSERVLDWNRSSKIMLYLLDNYFS